MIQLNVENHQNRNGEQAEKKCQDTPRLEGGLDQQVQFPNRLTKKERRNRKFFLKRIQTLVSVSVDSGLIEIQFGSQLQHVEIMQGGHPPIGQSNYKDVRQEVYSDDTECWRRNSTKGCQTISKVLTQNQLKQNREKTPSNVWEPFSSSYTIKFSNSNHQNGLNPIEFCRTNGRNIQQLIWEQKEILMKQHSILLAMTQD